MKEQLLRNWAGFAATHPWWVISGLLITTVLALLSASRLQVNMRWSDLLPERDPMAQEMERILEEYKSASTTIIVVQGDEHGIKGFAEAIVPQIEKLGEYVSRVDYKIDEDFFAQHGFMLAKARDLETSADMFKNLSLIPLLTQINDNFEEEYIGDEQALSTKEKEDNAVRALDGFHYWLTTMDRFISQPETADEALADSAVHRFLFGDPYFISYDKRVLLITVKPTFTAIDIDQCSASTVAIQAILDRTLPQFPGVDAGLTGTIPVQHDENTYVMKDMRISFVIALALVLLLFVLTFRMWSTPVLAGLTLVVSIFITAGVIAIYPGRLNPMTVMFGVILVGLGIDYSIHIISVYSERRAVDHDAPTAMEQTFLRSGSGILTAGLTTAVAFFALAISSSRGIKEMGIVLGMGILSAMLTTLTGLPALLVLRERFAARIGRKPLPARSIEFTVLGNFGKKVTQRPFLYLAIGVALTGFFVYQTSRVEFDYNMLNLEPRGMRSIALHDTIIEVFDLSPDFAMVTATSIEESWEIAEKAKEMPSISIVENIGDYCPPKAEQLERRPHVQEIRRLLSSPNKPLPLNKDNLDQLSQELERLDMNIYEISQLAFIGGQDKVDMKARSITGDPEAENPDNLILKLVGEIEGNPQKAIQRLSLFQKYYEPLFREKVYNMASPELITLNMLPEHVRGGYLNEAGNKFLVTIFAKEQIWHFESLKRFSAQVEKISPRITGTPPLTLRVIRYIGQDGMRATILTILIVLLLLWVDFRSLRMALLGIIPLLIGGVWMMGLMKTFGLMFTVMNVMGIPMIVGIGIDDGVHLLHRYRVEGLRRTPVVLKSTGKAILLTSLTTMVGFGSLIIARHRGFVGLGALLALGVGACFLTTVLFLPAIISLMLRRRREEHGNQSPTLKTE